MIQKIEEWLDKQGYPLEMNVAKELSASGFNCRQSYYHKDSETGKRREVDVVGAYGLTNSVNTINFQLIIECKNNQDKPWITFSDSINKPSFETYITNRPASRIGVKYLKHLKGSTDVKTKELFNVPSTFAYNVTEAFDTGSDKVYSAIMSVINATKYRRDRVNSEAKFNTLCEVYFPIIVIGGKLFDCYLNSDNVKCIEEVGHKYFFWRNDILETNGIIIEITTYDSFKSRLPTIKNDLHAIIAELSDDFFKENHTNSTDFGFL